MLTLKQLRKAKPENVIRLAKWLQLYIDGMSLGQIIRLIRWRVTRGISRH